MIYLAGPDVFLPDAADIGRRKLALCTAAGLEGFFPLEDGLGAEPGSRAIFDANLALMERAEAIIANLTPFRGPSADPGTVFELGYMAGRGTFCVGYSNDPRPYADRVRASAHDRGHRIEDFGLADNLMIVHALDAFGAPVVVPEAPPADPWHDLTAFEACVRLVAAWTKGRRGQ
ncbi:nucleoside 2-deoxyribosyltransferase [Rhodoplanes sp. TEM]|uniref:Nucleoside 2-deoxyribosyltransferase n=1 Tax=Rhodoplanes tepidamans TaxID=200616 RepID=A0ABT5J4D1_RHOTP|nr:MULTISPECIES: nucleoside 2-deoxyribosyltransferase [Rhodoplanes]MDC7784312.1 nucleoside 2-deoxyribosyltransferase [Rhodoplanes tepidamans]MDC7987826.1 nucleoside 2-deoxyribosyltransferase [Rhodoplanes sp. TEM]MDQ0353715.1 nucleoside 2-deoxyribosyltransferase [Rhodoplanes tepidamans]